MEEAKNYEPDAAVGSHDVGFINTYEAEAIDPVNTNLIDQEPNQTCGHGSEELSRRCLLAQSLTSIDTTW